MQNHFSSTQKNSLTLIKFLSLLCFFWGVIAPAQALFIKPPLKPLPVINKIFPQATRIGDKQGDPLLWTIYKKNKNQKEEIIGYAFETNDVAPIPAYSGEPVNTLVAINPKGTYLAAKVLEYHEPIILAGIPEKKLFDFADQYVGLKVNDKIKVGGNQLEGSVHVDGLSGATVTVRVMNVAITKTATKVARSLGLISKSDFIVQPMATIYPNIYKKTTWQSLIDDGSIKKLYLTRGDIDKAFKGTKVEHINEAKPSQKNDLFAEIYYAEADIPNIGRNVLGDDEFNWLKKALKPKEHAVIIFGNGYSYKGSGYVRGGIFDRIQLIQDENVITFHDLDHTRLSDLYTDGTPRFHEMSLFIIRAPYEFNPGTPWQLEFLVRRQIGAVSSQFTSFRTPYHALKKYVNRPPVVKPAPQLTLIQQIWHEKNIEIIILMTLMIILLTTLFFQDILVRYPTFLHKFRHSFLIVTVVFIGWSWGGQLSVVNVFTFLQSLMHNFSWNLFLLDPVIFILWGAAAVTILLWGRAVYCGWLCPFGALQELLNVIARYIKIPQIEFPWAVHERLWAIKYLILLGLFGLSLDSLAAAEKFAEIEPFKTTFLLKFHREWPFILYAITLLTINLFQRKFFCRYLCPLGAALSISNNIRLFNWLKRRSECGQPCKTCAKECEIQAIAPDGQINMRECHYCLDCQITYFNDEKCPPLKKLARKKRQFSKNPIPTVVTE